MKSLIIIVIVTNLCLVQSEISKDDADFESFNSTERKNTLLGLARTLDIFNVENLYQNWNVIKLNLSEECATDIDSYLHGLEKQEKWALKSKLYLDWDYLTCVLTARSAEILLLFIC